MSDPNQQERMHPTTEDNNGNNMTHISDNTLQQQQQQQQLNAATFSNSLPQQQHQVHRPCYNPFVVQQQQRMTMMYPQQQQQYSLGYPQQQTSPNGQSLYYYGNPYDVPQHQLTTTAPLASTTTYSSFDNNGAHHPLPPVPLPPPPPVVDDVSVVQKSSCEDGGSDSAAIRAASAAPAGAATPQKPKEEASRLSQMTPRQQQEWVQSIVGRDWEVFWKQGSSQPTTPVSLNDRGDGMALDQLAVSDGGSTSRKTDDPQDSTMDVDDNYDNSEEEEEADVIHHEDDWYDATVVAYHGCSEQSHSNDVCLYYFQLQFLGDDGILHQQPLTPETVRPSARAWIRRTRAMLKQPDDDNDRWEESLPPDTSTVADRETLESIAQQVMENHQPSDLCIDDDNAEFNKLSKQLQEERTECCRLSSLIRQQIFLRSRLVPIEQVHDTAALNVDDEPTEQYVNFLTKCLEHVQEACRWHDKCWKLLFGQIFTTSEHSSSLISRDVLVQQRLAAGRSVLATLLSTVDISPARGQAFLQQQQRRNTTAKRPLSSSTTAIISSSSTTSSPCVGRSARMRLAKRRKKSQGLSDYWLVPAGGDLVSSPEQGDSENIVEEEELLSPNLIKLFVERAGQTDKRWYSQLLGNMLTSVSTLVGAPYASWEHRAQFFLGERDSMDEGGVVVSSSDGETSQEETDYYYDDDDDDDGDSISQDGQPGSHRRRSAGRRYVKYEEIESLIDEAENDLVLRRFDLSDNVARLRQKLSDVDSFEKRAWDLISAVLDDNGEDKTGRNAFCDKEKDPTFQGLQVLLQEAISKEGPIENMMPIGRASSSLNRGVLENALVYRTWFLDLKYAESARERVSFVDDVVSRLSKLPPLPSRSGSDNTHRDTEIDVKLDRVSPRVRALSAKYFDHISFFNREQSMLTERILPQNVTERKGLLTLEGTKSAFDEIRKLPVISVAEEMLAVRFDVLVWEKEARSVLSKTKPSFLEISNLKKSADLILGGRSKTRVDVVGDKKPNPAVDAEVKAFAHADVRSLCGSLFSDVTALFETSAAWKERGDNILIVLKAFGNTFAGDPPAGSSKPAAMVDLRRIQDLLSEYESLDVDLTDMFDRLTRIREATIKWSSSMSSGLLNDSQTFAECLGFVEQLGQERPRGIIVNPTRQVVDALDELLRWYISVQLCALNQVYDQERIQALLSTGLLVVERFSQKMNTDHQFFALDKALQLITSREGVRKASRTMPVNKIESSPLSQAVLSRMIDAARDEKEGHPLLALLFVLWTFFVEEFVRQCHAPRASESDLPSLESAKKLFMARPVLPNAHSVAQAFEQSTNIAEFERIIQEGENMEKATRETLSASNGLLRESSNRMELVQSHLTRIKDLLVGFKSRFNTSGGVTLDPVLEQLLEQHNKLFGWLVRTFPYPFLHSHQFEMVQPIGNPEEDTRVPWDVLVSLHDRIPESDLVLGDFACVVVRVRELYEAANQWQKDISHFTMLSLRGVKRRAPSCLVKVGSDSRDDVDTCSSIDLDKVSKLTNDPILLKVAMPREKGIRNMLESTQKFEVLLHNFLGEDYNGKCPDRVAIPRGGSLMGEDGTFLLFRLTGSPLFEELKASVESISKVANDVLAHTPGKAAFDWIRQAVEWIDSMHASVTTNGTHETRRLIIPGCDAKKLVQRGDQIFLEIPEDLRKTLSDHKIYIAASKDGKLTVKSRKGGAHHAIGSTCIRWCPFLLDALKFDVSQLTAWEKAVARISEDFLSVRQYATGKQSNDSVVIQRFYRCREDFTQLLEEVEDLVVAPSSNLVDTCRTLRTNIETYLSMHSSPEAAKTFANSRYKEGEPLTTDRHLLLAALLERKSLAGGQPAEGIVKEASKDGPFRSAGRIIFAKALRKGAKTLDIDETDTSSALCALKAWEIETALFDLYQAELGETQISAGYRDKARALRRSLEDPSNVSLCANVLSGKLESESLVKISIEELANPRLKRDREMAAATARQNLVLNEVLSTGSSSTIQKKLAPNTKECSAQPKIQVQTPSPLGRPKSELQSPIASRPALKADLLPDNKATLLPHSSSPGSTSFRQTSRFGDLVKKTARTLGPPPPPPPLVMSLKPVSPATHSSPSQPSGDLVTNSSGGDQFFLTLADKSRKFYATLYAEYDPQSAKDGLLPETLAEKGRLRIPEFTKFVSGKLEGGKWVAAILRIATVSDKDAREYKKFYKEYEGNRKRIAMFSLPNGDKAFLVTPRFQQDAKGLVFDKTTSSYIVVLSKKRDY